MKILITGTDGFIGGHLKKYFKESGFNVFGTTFFKEPVSDEKRFDITRDEDFKRLPQADVIINATGIVDQKASKKTIFDVNAEGVRKLVEWGRQNNCKHFIQLSSIAVYGFKVMGENRGEDNTKRYEGRFWISYGRSKAKAEIYLEQGGLPYTILRLPSVYGKNDSVVASYIVPRLMNNKFYFATKKNKKFSPLYVKNLGPIIKRIIEIGPLNDYFNCSDHEITWNEFAYEFAKNLGNELKFQKKSILSLITHLKNSGYQYMITSSFFGAHFPNDKLLKKIDYTPEFSWQEGVREAVESFIKSPSHPPFPKGEVIFPPFSKGG